MPTLHVHLKIFVSFFFVKIFCFILLADINNNSSKQYTAGYHTEGRTNPSKFAASDNCQHRGTKPMQLTEGQTDTERKTVIDKQTEAQWTWSVCLL